MIRKTIFSLFLYAAALGFSATGATAGETAIRQAGTDNTYVRGPGLVTIQGRSWNSAFMVLDPAGRVVVSRTFDQWLWYSNFYDGYYASNGDIVLRMWVDRSSGSLAVFDGYTMSDRDKIHP